MMVEILLETKSGETEKEIEGCVREFVERLTGRQTIYQMIRLKEEVEKRGGRALEPLEYKRIYHARLWEKIKDRVAGLKEGTIEPRDMRVPFAEEMLRLLKERGVSLFLASGTDVEYVEDECRALGLSAYFDGGIYGALDDYQRFSKKMVIERIYWENDLSGRELLAFGDGYVEIENTREVGGVAVGVASDEFCRGRIDQWKRKRLIEAGADLIIPDYRDYGALVSYLFGGE